MNETEYKERLTMLCSKLLKEIQLLTNDRADSNLPEWEREALDLDIISKESWESFTVKL